MIVQILGDYSNIDEHWAFGVLGQTNSKISENDYVLVESLDGTKSIRVYFNKVRPLAETVEKAELIILGEKLAICDKVEKANFIFAETIGKRIMYAEPFVDEFTFSKDSHFNQVDSHNGEFIIECAKNACIPIAYHDIRRPTGVVMLDEQVLGVFDNPCNKAESLNEIYRIVKESKECIS